MSNKTPDVIIPLSLMEFVFVSDHYDIHLAGLCRVDGELCAFELDQETYANQNPLYNVYILNALQKLKELWGKKLFEVCVGHHWSYPERNGGAMFFYRYPKWFWKLIFKAYYIKW